MSFFFLRSRALSCAAIALFLILAVTTPVRAALTGYLSGVVTANGAPLANVTIRASGNNTVQSTTTDKAGRFSLALPLGTYDVVAHSSDNAQRAEQQIEIGSNGLSIALVLVATGTPKEVGHVAVVRTSPIRGSGADTTLNAAYLTRSPANGSFPELLIQLPGAARGANGVVHINGGHGDIGYIVDGVPIPQELNRNIGSEFDPSDVAFADVIEGAYPAQYGERFGGVINIATRAGNGPAGFGGNIEGGSYARGDSTLSYHTPLGSAGGLAISVRDERSDRGLDPPDFSSPHNAFSDSNQLVHATFALDAHDFLNTTLTHNYQTYQLPSYVSAGEPAQTDDNETQEDTFASVQFRHSFGNGSLLTFGPSLKISRIRDFGDPTNDFAFGIASNVATGGSTSDCENAITSGGFGPATCAYSLASDRTATDIRFQSDYTSRIGAHEIGAGIVYDYSDVGKRYAVTLQPGNFLARASSPATPDAPYTVVDGNSNAGNMYEAYVQDSWKLGNRYALDYGLRYDHFSIALATFANAYTQFSPRIKLTRFFGERASVYAYLGRFFTPFSFENVDPAAAGLLNLPLQPTAARFDLKPERDTMLELGAHLPLGAGSLGFRIWQKNANDLIDDTQVGQTLLHQDINYTLGRLSSQSLSYQLPLPRSGRAYASVAHTLSLNSGCETQLLAPCFGQPTGFTPADHDQRYDVTAGVLLDDLHDGWFALDGEYGSGLSSASCPENTPGYCKRTPHLTFDIEKGIGLAKALALTLRVRNLLNDRYDVTLQNAQGDHLASPRTFDLGIRFGK